MAAPFFHPCSIGAPIYTIIDMVETAENVWSDASVCAMTDHDLKGKLEDEEAAVTTLS